MSIDKSKLHQIDILTQEDLDNFMETLDDPNTIKGYFITFGEHELTIKGSKPVLFADCFFSFRYGDKHILSTRLKLRSDVDITLENCCFDDDYPTISLTSSSDQLPFENLCLQNLSCKDLHIVLEKSWTVVLIDTFPETCQRISISDAYLLNIIRGLPASVYTQSVHLVKLRWTQSSYTHRVNVYDSHCVDIEDVSLEQATIFIQHSILSPMNVVKSRLHCLYFDTCVIPRLFTDASHIDLLNAICSVARSLTHNSYVPTAMTYSVGFPETTEITLYKKVKITAPLRKAKYAILELKVKGTAKKHYGSGKLRVSEATPVCLYALPGLEPIKKPFLGSIRSISYDNSYKYYIGKPATPRLPYDNGNSDCASGIHGFMDIEDAKAYGDY